MSYLGQVQNPPRDGYHYKGNHFWIHWHYFFVYILPFFDIIKRFINVFSISADKLMNHNENSVVELQNHELNEQLMLISQLDEDEKNALVKIINSMLTKKTNEGFIGWESEVVKIIFCLVGQFITAIKFPFWTITAKSLTINRAFALYFD
jgi:hypothetical protein